VLTGYGKPPTREEARIIYQHQQAAGCLSSVIVACKIDSMHSETDRLLFAERCAKLAFEIGAQMAVQAEALGMFEQNE
jgi:hypothetical protein